MSIRSALDALLETLQGAGVPLVASMAPGLTRAEIDAIEAPLPGRLASEVIEYFAWRNGLAPDRGADVELFPQGIPLALDEAAAQFRMQRDVAEQIAKQSGVPSNTIWDERWNAARSLGELRDPRAIPGLIRALDDPADVVAKTVAASLGLMKARDAIAALIQALERSGPQTRNVSAWALGEMKAEAAREAPTRALDDPLGMVRQSAAAALQRLDQKRR